jgi:hypothetical protein
MHSPTETSISARADAANLLGIPIVVADDAGPTCGDVVDDGRHDLEEAFVHILLLEEEDDDCSGCCWCKEKASTSVQMMILNQRRHDALRNGFPLAPGTAYLMDQWGRPIDQHV